MSGNSGKAADLANEAIGKAKQGIGNVVGLDRIKAEERRKHSRSMPRRRPEMQRMRQRNPWTRLQRL